MTDQTTSEDKKSKTVGGSIPIEIIRQYVKDLSFENPNTPGSVLSHIPEPDTQFKLNVQGRHLKEDLAESVLMIRIEVKNKKNDKLVFILEMAYGCVLSLKGIDPDDHKRVLMVEAPRMMFPFAREVIARTTTDGGYQAMYINAIRFEDIFDKKQNGELESPEASSAS